MRKNKLYALWFFISLLLLSCSSSEETVFPGQEWTYLQNPEDEGWGVEEREKLRQYLDQKTQVTGLMLIYKGQVVFEYGNLSENSYIASCRKSILSMLYGKHVDSGEIVLNKTLEEIGIDDKTPLLPIEKKARIVDLISARSGIFLNGSNGGDFRQFAPERGSVEPGTYWLYSNWDFNTAGYIFEKETGKDIYDEIENQLVFPLQMQDWDRSLQMKSGDSTVSLFPAYHMWFSTRDMARIGLLMLNKGKWGNTQIIPESWVNEMVKQRTPYFEAQANVPVLKEDGLDLGYGYMWWLIENTDDQRLKNAYSAQGARGQGITVYPDIQTVLIYKTNTDKGKRNSIQTQMDIIKNSVRIYDPD